MSSPIIDAHVHLFQEGFLPQRWYEAVAERWAASTWPHRDPDALDVEGGIVDAGGELLFEEMESAGLDGVVCMNLDWGLSLGEAALAPRDINKLYGALQRENPGRFNAVVGVDPRRPDAVDIIRHGVSDHRLKGVKIYPPCGFYADDPSCNPIYQACLDLDVPVVIHTAFIGYPHQGHFANPSHIAAVQAAFPDLRIVLAHAGHNFWLDEALAVTAAHPHTYLDISNWNELLHRDPGELNAVLRRMVREVGAHRMLFASDHLGGRRFSGKDRVSRWLSYIDELPLSTQGEIGQEQTSLILGENAVRVFKLDVSAGVGARGRGA